MNLAAEQLETTPQKRYNAPITESQE